VYSPALLCEDGSDSRFVGPGFVGKAIPADKLVWEMQHAVALKALGDVVIVPLHDCVLSKSQTNANFIKNINDENDSYTHQIIYLNGGQSVHAILQDRKKHKEVLTAIKEFIPKLLEFNRHYTHSDLHLENLVYDGHQVRMIDFEQLEVEPDSAHIDISTLFFHLGANLSNYSKKNKCDETYNKWLADNEALVAKASINELVEAINTIPTVKAPTGCTIMG